MTDQLWWHVARSSGIVAWGLVAAGVLWGLVLSGKPFGRHPRPAWVLDLHRYLGGLAVVFGVVHGIGLWLDSWAAFGPLELLVPLTGSYRPGAVAWGVVAAYLLLAVELTSLLRSRVPKRLWRRVHGLSFPLYGLSTLHLLQAGTDAHNPLLVGTVWATTSAVVTLTAFRVLQVRGAGTTPTTRSAVRPERSAQGGDARRRGVELEPDALPAAGQRVHSPAP